MAEIVAVAGDTLSPVQMAPVVNGSRVDVDRVLSASCTITDIDGTPVVFALTPDAPSNSLTATLPSALTDIPGVYLGHATLITNSGTYRFPDGNLTLIVLEGDSVEHGTPLVDELGNFLVTDDGYLLV